MYEKPLPLLSVPWGQVMILLLFHPQALTSPLFHPAPNSPSSFGATLERGVVAGHWLTPQDSGDWSQHPISSSPASTYSQPQMAQIFPPKTTRGGGEFSKLKN